MKKWYQSSTIWINVVPLLIMGLDLLIQSNVIPDPDVLMTIQGILNILNRFRAPSRVLPIEKSLT